MTLINTEYQKQMTEDEVVEQTDTIDQVEKEAREYSQEYITELISAAKEYLPRTVWEHIHRRAVPKAGGKASGKSKRNAAAAAQEAAAHTQTITPELEGQLQEAQAEPTKKADKADMHPDCQKVADNCMSMKKENTEKAAAPKLNAPVATGAWDGAGAQKRLLAWAGGPDKENVDWAKFGKGFLYHDASAPDNVTSYKFPIADVQGGKLVVNRSALAAAAGRINQTTGISSADLERMKATLRSHYNDLGVDAPANIAKSDQIETFVGSHPLISFVAASPGIIESVRKSALVGTTGKIFNEQYLKPLGLKRDDIAILYLVPRLLKSDDGKVREPTQEEIEAENLIWKYREPDGRLTVALGHTVKKSLGSVVDVTLPHPNALGTVRTNQELIRKREQLKKMLNARKARGNKKRLNTPQENL